MNYFVLFSAIIIAVSVVILLLPSSNAEEGFATRRRGEKAEAEAISMAEPSAAGQRNASGNAGSADGSSDHDFLLDNLLMKHDKLAEGFENREKKPQNTVSSTTTQKKGIASTSGRYKGDRVRIPVAGCNKDKCMEIGKTQSVFDPMAAIDGNCVNPTLPNGDPDYSIKYCAAFRPKDDTMDAQECLTCGYYTYAADCLKYADPKDPDKCTQYGNYTFQQPTGTSENYLTCDTDDTVCKLLAQQFGGGGDQGQGQGSSGPICSESTCQTNTITIGDNQCVIPGCYSADDGMMPYPNDFYGNSTINPCINDPTNGFMCPAITSGTTYDSGGGSTDLCYMTNTNTNPALPPNYIIDRSKFVPMDTVCSNDKQKSKQLFVPGKDAPIDDNDNHIKRRSASKTGATTSAIQHQHQHGGAINVYHYHMNSTGSKNTKDGKNSNTNKNQGYMEPEAGASVLGFL
jgi:hypothetical protein